jgi:hypothetical protein
MVTKGLRFEKVALFQLSDTPKSHEDQRSTPSLEYNDLDRPTDRHRLTRAWTLHIIYTNGWYSFGAIFGAVFFCIVVHILKPFTMNGSTASSASDHHHQLQFHDYKASDCSFYLNLVVLDHLFKEQQNGGDSPSKSASGGELQENYSSDDLRIDDDDDMTTDNDASDANGGTEQDGKGEPEQQQQAEETNKNALLKAAGGTKGSTGIFKKSLSGLEFSNSIGGKAFSMGKALHGVDKSFRSSMNGLSKASSQVANKAGAYAARKTMVNRAHITLNKCLPDLSSLYGTDLTIGRRFSQGKVTVLHVTLKPLAMPRYLSDVKDDEAAKKYSSAIATLEALGATETMKCLEREMLDQVRKGLMQKLSTLLLQKMNEMESGLELECIALEEAEEARWLFTFMEFQAQMKS